MLATVAAAQRDRWDTTAELLVGILQAVDYGNRLAFVGHRMKGKVPKPIVINRPGDESEKPKLTREAMRAVLLGG